MTSSYLFRCQWRTLLLSRRRYSGYGSTTALYIHNQHTTSGDGAVASPRQVSCVSASSSLLSREGGEITRSSLIPSDMLAALLDPANAACEVPLGDIGHGSRHRVFHNFNRESRPWEASCMEVRNTRRWDEKHDLSAQSETRNLRGHVRRLNLSPPSSSSSSASSPDGPTADAPLSDHRRAKAVDSVEVVFYFETSTKEGLDGFRLIADRVLSGELPGECRNMTGQGGFATWIVSRPEFASLLPPHLQKRDDVRQLISRDLPLNVTDVDDGRGLRGSDERQ